MKKFLIVFMAAWGISSSYVWAIEEIVVTGYPNPAPTWSGLMSGFAAPVPQTFYSTTYSAEAYAAMLKAQKKGECEGKANYTEQSCKTAYTDLSNYCRAFNIFAGGAAVGSFKLLYAKLSGSALDAGVSYAVTSGAAAAGVSEQDLLVPCSDLTAKAMSYCAAGAAKMKESCKNI